MFKIKSKTVRRFYPRQLLNRLNGKKPESLSPYDRDVLSFFLKKSRKYGVEIMVTHRVVVGKKRILHSITDTYQTALSEPLISSENLVKLHQLEKNLNLAKLHILNKA